MLCCSAVRVTLGFEYAKWPFIQFNIFERVDGTVFEQLVSSAVYGEDGCKESFAKLHMGSEIDDHEPTPMV